MKAQQNEPILKRGIYVNEIEFISKGEVNLFGFLQHGGKFIETQFVIPRKGLQVLLSDNARVGIEILWLIEQLFVLPHRAPASLNLVELFGTTLLLKAKEIRVEPCFSIEGSGYDLAFIEEVIPLGVKKSNGMNGANPALVK